MNNCHVACKDYLEFLELQLQMHVSFGGIAVNSRLDTLDLCSKATIISIQLLSLNQKKSSQSLPYYDADQKRHRPTSSSELDSQTGDMVHMPGHRKFPLLWGRDLGWQKPLYWCLMMEILALPTPSVRDSVCSFLLESIE